MASPRIVTVGHITHDVYPDGIEAGGCALYASLTHRALGGEVKLITAVGDDFRCDEALGGLDATVHRGGATTCFQNIYRPGEPRLQRVDTQAPPVSLPALESTDSPLDVLHLTPVLGEVDLDVWSRIGPVHLRALNIQGWIKKAGPPFARAHPQLAAGCPPTARTVVQTAWKPSPETLSRFQVVCVGAEDLIDQGDLLDRLIASVPIVSCTDGRAGCTVFCEGRSIRIGVHPAREVDPTGAGDVFAAGFVYGLAAGQGPEQAARLAAACASIAVEAVGPRALGRLCGEAADRAEQVPVLG